MTRSKAAGRRRDMSEAYLTNWSFGGESPASRDHFHDTAIREARVATEYRKLDQAPATDAVSFLARLRLALARPTAQEACNCPA
jgi:hypothetical protein